MNEKTATGIVALGLNGYFEAVLVRVKDKPSVRALCRAPAFYGFEEGDEVIFTDTEGWGEVRGTVLRACTMKIVDEVTDFVLQMFCNGSESPFDLPKIIRRIAEVNVTYFPEDEKEEENVNQKV